jgi:hypothetical protein
MVMQTIHAMRCLDYFHDTNIPPQGSFIHG